MSIQAQCPPQPFMFVSGSGCIGYQGNGGDNANPLPPAPVMSSADAWASYNTWLAGSQAMQAADTQRVLPSVLLWGGAAAAVALLAPGGWKLAAVVPAFMAYMTYGLKGGM